MIDSTPEVVAVPYGQRGSHNFEALNGNASFTNQLQAAAVDPSLEITIVISRSMRYRYGIHADPLSSR